MACQEQKHAVRGDEGWHAEDREGQGNVNCTNEQPVPFNATPIHSKIAVVHCTIFPIVLFVLTSLLLSSLLFSSVRCCVRVPLTRVCRSCLAARATLTSATMPSSLTTPSYPWCATVQRASIAMCHVTSCHIVSCHTDDVTFSHVASNALHIATIVFPIIL